MKRFLALTIAALLASPAGASDPGTYRRDVHAWYDAFTQKDPALLDKILAPSWVDIPSPPGLPPGPAAARMLLTQLTGAFPDLNLVVHDVIQEGNKVVVRATMSGTQKRDFAGIAARDRRMSIQVVDIHEFEDGKIVRTWHTEDWMTGLRELGAFER